MKDGETKAKHHPDCQCPECYPDCPAGGAHDFSKWSDWCSKCGTMWTFDTGPTGGIGMSVPYHYSKVMTVKKTGEVGTSESILSKVSVDVREDGAAT